MDEAQVKRLEADLAREQRILEREKKINAEYTKSLSLLEPSVLKLKPKTMDEKPFMVAKQTDNEMLNALLQTVYKRRALKLAGAVVSVPKKGKHTRLGELANVKFLVVTANYSDLDVLHHLIYMSETNKSRVRKNILDFAGFNFSEDSPAYLQRMEFLNSLGYDISKRIGFLLGLCPYKTDIAQIDLNELIMYFLMSPCQSKQIPIRHLPQTFFSKDMPEEICMLMQKHSEELSISPADSPAASEDVTRPPELEITVADQPPKQPLPHDSENPRKAKKSFRSPLFSPKWSKTVPPSTPKHPLKEPLKPSQSILLPGSSQKIYLPPPTNSPRLVLPKAVVNPPAAAPQLQEFLIQQQTPDGKQKTYKLIKLPPNHPFNSALKNQSAQQGPLLLQGAPLQVQAAPQQSILIPPLVGGTLPPGLVLMKGGTVPPSVPGPAFVMSQPPSTAVGSNVLKGQLQTTANDDDDTDDGNEPIVPECDYGKDDAEELNPLAESASPPTDEDLYASIREVIHSSNFEDITLRNVIDRVAAQYSAHDLTHKHPFMKVCIKKIIMGS